jgi:signal transduction histidine kinase
MNLAFFGPALCVAVLIAVLLGTGNFLVEEVVETSWGRELTFNKTHYVLYGLYIVITLIFPFYQFYKLKNKLSGLYRSQAKMLYYGLGVTSILGLFFSLILPWFGIYSLFWAGPLVASASLFAIAYTIVRHRMVDTKSFIIRFLAYVLALGLITIVYLLGTYFIAERFLADGTFTAQVSTAGLFFVGAVLYQPIKEFFQKYTNRFFYRDAYDSQGLIDNLNETLVKNVELGAMLTSSAQIIQDNLKTSYCTFFIRETSYMENRTFGVSTGNKKTHDLSGLQELSSKMHSKVYSTESEPTNQAERALIELMKKNDVEVLARLVSTLEYELKGNGYILLGPKQSGSPYSVQDLKILEIVANELVIAVENALRLEEIEKFNVTLQNKIDDATRELRRSNEKLKALDEAKDEFVSMASHQLRTPLTSIKGYLSMVLEGDAGKVSPVQKDMLGQALFSSQRMVYLISDLLNVSRLKTGKFLIEPTVVYLPDVVQSEIDQLRDNAKSRDLTIEFVKPESFSRLMLDETKLRQVIMNLTDNAIYYTPSGGTIQIALKETSKSVEFTVTDNGIGVPKEQEHLLFAKFYRAENARKARPDGTGLGLFMAKKVIIAQGGSIIFKSKENKGSTFGFSFPKEKLLAPDQPKA